MAVLKLIRTRRLNLVMVLMVLAAGRGRGEALDEYQVKAAFLYNFAKFVEWPPGTFQSAADPIAICILGPDPFGGALHEAVRGKAVGGRTFRIAVISDARQAAGCQILFIHSSVRKRQPTLLRELAVPGLLTVGEWEDFAAQGGMIHLKLEEGKVRMEINAAAAERAGLRISSKLLHLARIVHHQAGLR